MSACQFEGARGHDIDRPSIRLQHPPGGRSSIVFGDDPPEKQAPKPRPRVVDPNAQSEQPPPPQNRGRGGQNPDNFRNTRPW
ncbi:hypothetical protein BLNAU_5896 [Blattamonas nauphoetae]|uniref:Uncharacterized protein n=1 Tax=Blattamonas nauphoetae TaxID=2049346 RepID=A0ABQ9Y5T8_9EUKA|nr:hypothetical protein BLNAU_5896 [Blattamonas nauphoetae]